jgi:hypothetical protein
MATPEEFRIRFWSRVDMHGLDECWPWKGRINWAGYGSFSAGGKEWRANRVAWMLSEGPLKTGEHVLHRCDIPPCCNPRHLFLGDPTVNAADRDAKKRGVTPKRVFGEETTGAKLTTADVLDIRRRHSIGERIVDIAKSYPFVRDRAIGKIVRRERWTHL